MKKLSIVLLILFSILCFLLSAVVFGLYAYSRINTVKGSGIIETESRDLKIFRKVTVNIPAEVVIEEGSKEKIEIETDDNIIKGIETNVSGRKLTIKYKNDIVMLFPKNYKPTDAIRIRITTTDIEELKVNGSASFKGANNYVLNTDKLKIDINGSGRVELEVKVKELDVDVSGSGELSLLGVANKQDINISGSGKYLALDLETQETKIDVSGSGEAEVSAENKLDINISGSGKISYKGDPDKFSQNISGSGEVKKVK